MYASLLTLHSWLRWLALGAVLFVFLRSVRGVVATTAWTRADMSWLKGAAHTMSIQFLLGILVFAVSPYVRSLMSDMADTMRDRTARFIAVEHPTVMVLAVALVHIAAIAVRGAGTDKAKHTRAAVCFGLALLLIGYGIPWTRPFLRLGL
jgi:hypothetical protein